MIVIAVRYHDDTLRVPRFIPVERDPEVTVVTIAEAVINGLGLIEAIVCEVAFLRRREIQLRVKRFRFGANLFQMNLHGRG